MFETIKLTDRERATVGQIVSSFAERIGPVRVFDSRATGEARPASDLDLVVYPPFSERDRYDLMEAFEESDLPILVDVLAADQLDDGFRRAIKRHSVPLLACDQDVAR